MKSLFIAVAFVVSSLGCATVQAHDGHHRMNHRNCAKECKCKPYATLKVVPLKDVLKEVGGYSKETTGKAMDGVGTVLKGTGKFFSAPFKSRFRWPEMKHYRWYRGHWHEVPAIPPFKLKGLPEGVVPKDLKPPKIDLGVPADDKGYMPVPFFEPEIKDTIVFFERRF